MRPVSPTECSKFHQPGTPTRIIKIAPARYPHPNHQNCTCPVPPPESSKLHLPGTPTRIIKIAPARCPHRNHQNCTCPVDPPFLSKLCYPTRTIKFAPARYPIQIIKIAPPRLPPCTHQIIAPTRWLPKHNAAPPPPHRESISSSIYDGQKPNHKLTPLLR
jgi:hypothetical protein